MCIEGFAARTKNAAFTVALLLALSTMLPGANEALADCRSDTYFCYPTSGAYQPNPPNGCFYMDYTEGTIRLPGCSGTGGEANLLDGPKCPASYLATWIADHCAEYTSQNNDLPCSCYTGYQIGGRLQRSAGTA